MNQIKTYGIVGDGRVARHFCRYLELLKIPFRQWSRASAVSTGTRLRQALGECDILLALVRDEAIEPVIRSAPELSDKRWVHFSGSLATPLAWGAHPLMSFGSELYDLETYRSIAFVHDVDDDDEVDDDGRRFGEMLPGLPNRGYPLAPTLKANYHALCVMAGNFSAILWKKLFEELEVRHQIPREAALPYLAAVSSNLARNPSGALTGPLQRGDWATVARNLEALEGDSFREIYQAFVRQQNQEKTR